jgi:hypothetical protein
MNYWLHRISHHAEIAYPLLDKGYLSIGFSDFATQEFIDKVLIGATWEERWAVLEKEVDNAWGHRPRTRHNMWRFIEGFKKGDRVVVPSWGTFSVFELISEKPEPIGNVKIENIKDWNNNDLKIKNGLINRNEEDIDLGFFWIVKPIAQQISRYDYADASLTARMKIRNTNAWITDLKESVEKAILAFDTNKPINLHSQIVENIVPNILNTLKTELTPDKLEYLVKWYFERIGATDVYIPAKNERDKEGDADVIATFEQIRTIIYAQVKFHGGETNSWAIQQIRDYRNKQEQKEYMDDEYSKLTWVISTADNYSNECFNLAKEEKVQLINGVKFAKMMIEAGILNLNKAL